MSENHSECGSEETVACPPLAANEAQRRLAVADELDAISRRLLELQAMLTERFSRQSWDEYMRLRRASRAQKLK